MHNGAQLSPCHEVSLGLLEGFRAKVGLGVSPGVDVGLGASLSCSESVLQNLSPVDDLGRHPHAGRRPDLNGCDDRCLGDVLDLRDMYGLRLVHRDGSGNRHCVDLFSPELSTRSCLTRIYLRQSGQHARFVSLYDRNCCTGC